MQMIFVVPKEGMKLRNPATGKLLKSEGEKVLKNSFWLRRIAEGDVESIDMESQKGESDEGGEQ